MKSGSRVRNWMVRALFASYMYALFKIIVLKFGPMDAAFLWDRLQRNLAHPEYIAARLQAGNLIPLQEISRALDGLSGHSLLNLFGNVALFVPLGMFLCALPEGRKMTLSGALWLSLGVSFGLESAQVLCSVGTFDVDDLILNSAGGLIGFVMYRLICGPTSAGRKRSRRGAAAREI